MMVPTKLRKAPLLILFLVTVTASDVWASNLDPCELAALSDDNSLIRLPDISLTHEESKQRLNLALKIYGAMTKIISDKALETKKLVPVELAPPGIMALSWMGNYGDKTTLERLKKTRNLLPAGADSPTSKAVDEAISNLSVATAMPDDYRRAMARQWLKAATELLQKSPTLSFADKDYDRRGILASIDVLERDEIPADQLVVDQFRVHTTDENWGIHEENDALRFMEDLSRSRKNVIQVAALSDVAPFLQPFPGHAPVKFPWVRVSLPKIPTWVGRHIGRVMYNFVQHVPGMPRSNELTVTLPGSQNADFHADRFTGTNNISVTARILFMHGDGRVTKLDDIENEFHLDLPELWDLL